MARAVATALESSPLKGDNRRQQTRVFLRQMIQVSGLIVIDENDEEHLLGLIEALMLSSTPERLQTSSTLRTGLSTSRVSIA